MHIQANLSAIRHYYNLHTLELQAPLNDGKILHIFLVIGMRAQNIHTYKDLNKYKQAGNMV